MLKMIKTALTSAVLASLPLSADVIGGELSLGFFSHIPSGNASYSFLGNDAAIDVEDTFYWESEQDLVMKAYLEHPFPFVPNLRIAHTTFSQSGSGEVSAFEWGDIVGFSGSMSNTMDLTMTDITLYYELLDNWVSVDAGINARYIEGSSSVITQAALVQQEESFTFGEWIPMVYLKGRFDFPVTDLSLQVETNALSVGDATMYDLELSARYTAFFGLGIEGGYKILHLDSDNLVNNLSIDLDFQGPYAAVVWDF